MPDSEGALPRGTRVLVTGATGLVGNNVTRLLAARGYRVRVLTRPLSDPRPLAGLDVEIARGDVTDPASLEESLRESRLSFMPPDMSSWVGKTPHNTKRSISRGPCTWRPRLARWARMIHVSTVNTLGIGTKHQLAHEQWSAAENIACPYVVSKKAAETAVRQQIELGLDAVIVHPGLMFGPWDWKPSSGRMILEVARNFTPMAPKGGSSICDVRDVGDAIIAALDKAPTGRTYVLAGHNVTYLKLWQHIADIAGGTRPLCRCGPLIRLALGRGGDFWGWLTGHEPDVNSATIRLSDCYHYFDSSRAQRELGYQIRPVVESLRDAWHWFQEYGYVPR